MALNRLDRPAWAAQLKLLAQHLAAIARACPECRRQGAVGCPDCLAPAEWSRSLEGHADGLLIEEIEAVLVTSRPGLGVGR